MGIIIEERKARYGNKDVWLEKYRPSDLNEVVLPDKYRKKFQEFINNKEFPSLLLIGSPGTGKTTMAYILLDACIGDTADFLEMNGSLFRGIDVIRSLDDFIKSDSMFSKRKVIFIDEADKLTADAQDSLRNLIEQNSDHLSFMLTANYPHKITDALKSRLQTYKFEKLPEDNRRSFVYKVLANENIRYDSNEVEYIIKATDPDLRKCLNEINKAVLTDSTGQKVLSLGNTDESFLIEEKFVENITNMLIFAQQGNQEAMKQCCSWGYKQIMSDSMNYETVYEKLVVVLNIVRLKTMTAHSYNQMATCVSPKMLMMEFFGDLITYIRTLYRMG